ncbi:MAG: type II secretion system protein [Planctomycetota bacterium]|jgi:prepilin-type N-terminal cleavage/methylation domain-containing protein
MRTRKYEYGVTLTEMLIVVAVIAILATMVIGVATRIDTQAKEKGVESTFVLLEGALQEYYDYKGGFPVAMNADPNVNSEILYAELSSVPSSRKILEKISDSLIKHGVETGVIPPIPEIYDPWGMVLDYRDDPGRDTFPKLISAGPDRDFGTADDISNK